MTTTPTVSTRVPGAEPDDGWSGYSAALALLVAGAVVESGAVFDRLVPPGVLVEELPDRVRSMLVAALARSWVGWQARAASLASVSAAGWLAGERGAIVSPMLPPRPSADLPRLTSAADAVLEHAGQMATGGDLVDATPIPDGRHAEADVVSLQQRRAKDAEARLTDVLHQMGLERAREDAADKAERVDVVAMVRQIEEQQRQEQEAERQAIADLQRADAAADAEDARRAAEQQATDNRQAEADAAQDRRARMEQARADRQAVRDEQAADRAANRSAEMDAARAKRQAREDRRLAQRARAEQVARDVAAKAAHDELTASLEHAVEAVGWTRQLDADPCARCVAWWQSGSVDGRPASLVRPWSVRMKRHRGCQCVRRPTTRAEGEHRDHTTEPERAPRGVRHDRPDDTSHERTAQPEDHANA